MVAFELGVLGFVDYAHAAFAELFEDSVVEDFLTDHFIILRSLISYSITITGRPNSVSGKHAIGPHKNNC